jgi:hypothetical protein
MRFVTQYGGALYNIYITKLLAFAGLPNFGCFVVAPSIRYNKTFGFIVVTFERQQSFNKNWLRQKYIWAILVYNL